MHILSHADPRLLCVCVSVCLSINECKYGQKLCKGRPRRGHKEVVRKMKGQRHMRQGGKDSGGVACKGGS